MIGLSVLLTVIEFEMAGKSREVDPSDEFQNTPDGEALLREDAAGAEICSKTKETPNESFVELMATMNDNMTVMLDSMSWMGSSLKRLHEASGTSSRPSKKKKRKMLKTHLMKKWDKGLAMRATVLVIRRPFGKWRQK